MHCEGGFDGILKESERSLRAYFIVVGIIATALALHAFSDSSKVPRLTSLRPMTLAIWFPVLSRLVLGPAFVVAGTAQGHGEDQPPAHAFRVTHCALRGNDAVRTAHDPIACA